MEGGFGRVYGASAACQLDVFKGWDYIVYSVFAAARFEAFVEGVNGVAVRHKVAARAGISVAADGHVGECQLCRCGGSVGEHRVHAFDAVAD